MIEIYEGGKISVGFKFARLSGSGAIPLVNQQCRILNASRQLAVDWTAAQWDATASELSYLFDATLPGLAAPGAYYVQFRGDIGAERPQKELTVVVKDWGP